MFILLILNQYKERGERRERRKKKKRKEKKERGIKLYIMELIDNYKDVLDL